MLITALSIAVALVIVVVWAQAASRRPSELRDERPAGPAPASSHDGA
jgi:hypothetical protein